MSTTVENNSILRKRWDKWLSWNRDSFRDCARRAGLSHVTIIQAVKKGVATEPTREALRRAGIPEELIPLPACTSTLAAMIYKQQEIP